MGGEGNDKDYMPKHGPNAIVQQPVKPYEVVSPGGLGIPQPKVEQGGDVVQAERLRTPSISTPSAATATTAAQPANVNVNAGGKLAAVVRGGVENVTYGDAADAGANAGEEDADYMQTRGPNAAAQPAVKPYEVVSPGGLGIPQPKVEQGGDVLQAERLRLPSTSKPSSETATTTDEKRRRSRAATLGRTVIVEGTFGVALPGKPKQSTLHIVCTASRETASGMLEVYDSKAAMGKKMAKLTMRVKNIVRIEKTAVKSKLCVLVEDTANRGKPLIVFSESGAAIDELHVFFSTVGRTGTSGDATDESRL
jgi:hypothetical protein